MRRFQEQEAARKQGQSAPPKAPSPAKAASPAPAPASAPQAQPVKASSLSPSAIRALQQRGASAQAVTNIDAALVRFSTGKVGPEGVFLAAKSSIGKDGAFDVFPDVIGSLPRGEARSQLNAWFQGQAS